MTNSARYLGSDLGLNRITEAGNAVAAAAVETTARAGESVSQFNQENVRRAKDLLDLNSQLFQARLQASSQPSGLAGLFSEAGKTIIGLEEQKIKKEQQRQLEQQKLQEKELAARQNANEITATRIIGEVNTEVASGKLNNDQVQAEIDKRLNAAGVGSKVQVSTYNDEGARRVLTKQQEAYAGAAKETRTEQQQLAFGDLQVQLSKLSESEPGVERFRAAASKLVADKMPYLSTNDVLAAMSVVNKVSEDRATRQTISLQDEATKVSDQRAEQRRLVASVKLAPLLATIKNLPPTDQAAPYLAAVQQQIAAVVADPTLTEEQSFRIANSLIQQTQESYAGKAEAYAKYTVNIDNMANYIKDYRYARAAYEIDGNLDLFKGRVENIKAQYGDFRDAVAAPGELEKQRAAVVSDINTVNNIQRAAIGNAGVNINLDDAFIPVTVKSIISNPGLIGQLENDPALSNNAQVKTAITLAKRYTSYEEDFSKLQEWKATQGVKYANVNLSIANNRAAFLEAFIKRRAQELVPNSPTAHSPEQEQFDRVVFNNVPPAIQEYLETQAQKLLRNPRAKIDPNELKKASDLSEQGLVGVLSAIGLEVQTRDAQLYQRYRDLEQYGLLKPRDQLKPTEADRLLFTESTTKARQAIQEQAGSTLQTQQYGVQSNFNGSSAYGADVDERGLVRLAPRTSLQTTTYNGKTVITPLAKGNGASVTSAFQSARPGGRRHAGLDFGQNAGEPGIALVSGTAYVNNDATGYGGYVDIVADNGYVYRYAHQMPLVKSGQRIKAGSVISRGDGSGVGAPHLHFEVHKGANFDAQGNYQPKYGISNVVDPLEHLQHLSASASNVLQPRVQNNAGARANPRARVSNNTVVLSQGGALQANSVQFLRNNGQTTGAVRAAGAVYGSQRPVTQGSLPWNIGDPSGVKYDFDDDFGYAPLRQNQRFRVALNEAAKELGVPAVWIADIIRQESGAAMSAATVHNGGLNYGLFGFGNDSFNDVKIPDIKNMDEAAQLKLFVRYQKENGWTKHLQQRGGNASVADFWALARFGNNYRRQALADPVGFLSKKLHDTGATWGQEVGLLGKWAGRAYSFPGSTNDRKLRSSAVDDEYTASCKVCEQMVASASNILAHRHDIA